MLCVCAGGVYVCVVPHDSSDRSLKAGVRHVAWRAVGGGLCVSPAWHACWDAGPGCGLAVPIK